MSFVPNVGNPVFANEKAYMELEARDAGFHLLAVSRLWNVIECWFPYQDLIGEDRDAVLAGVDERRDAVSGKNLLPKGSSGRTCIGREATDGWSAPVDALGTDARWCASYWTLDSSALIVGQSSQSGVTGPC